MTDNSAAEKAALQAVWPQGTQLLCFFHVAQAEWRWLTAAHNNVAKEHRRSLMSAFRQIMYADSPEKLESATIKLRESSQTSYFSRVEAFLNRKEEWVLMFRNKVITRGHNTNNFAEASIRILKDIVLSRTKAFNAVALVESIAEVWELYFKSRILKHAHNRVPTHHLLYDSLLKKAPEGVESSVISLGDNCFSVPSFGENGEVYDVCGDIGLCTCPAGCTGAFCKHQALVHKHFGGIFPNCPALTIADRHELGRLALGDACPGIEFFASFCDPIEVQSEQHGPELQHETVAPNEDEEQQDYPAVLQQEVCPSASGLEQQDSQRLQQLLNEELVDNCTQRLLSDCRLATNSLLLRELFPECPPHSLVVSLATTPEDMSLHNLAELANRITDYSARAWGLQSVGLHQKYDQRHVIQQHQLTIITDLQHPTKVGNSIN
ncbi:uncharacterized protein [Dermacentor albipictus]|uniref:uncharacterized protein n=1 Tax=Dermacentor albipictus TaxID=60249 RepID=UPI0038FCD2AE